MTICRTLCRCYWCRCPRDPFGLPLAAVTVLLLPWLTLGALGQEKVKLKSGLTVSGTILQYDERGINMRLQSGNEARYTLDEIDTVDAELSPLHQQADEAVAQEDYDMAISRYKSALVDERRPWAQARLRLGLLRCYQKAGQVGPAGVQFLELSLVRDDVDVMALAPLLWVPGQKVSDDALAAARRWLTDEEHPMARLVACSWLLGGDDRAKVIPVLKRLQTEKEQRISWLARAQMWRQETEPVSEEEIGRFRDLIEKMPESIRGGPYYVLGLAYERADAPVDAALAFLWVPFVYDESTTLSTDAMLRAARASEQADFEEDALRLYQELATKYSDTAAGAQAEAQLKKRREKPASAEK